MADVHESLIRSFRKRVIRGGLKETKSPMPSYRPDIFAQKLAQNGSIVEQLAVEAEIASTLFSEHTAEQLLKMHDFMVGQKMKRIRIRGFLIIPKGKQPRNHADLVLSGLFPDGTSIRVVQAGQ
jgi:hypothetical protein